MRFILPNELEAIFMREIMANTKDCCHFNEMKWYSTFVRSAANWRFVNLWMWWRRQMKCEERNEWYTIRLYCMDVTTKYAKTKQQTAVHATHAHEHEHKPQGFILQIDSSFTNQSILDWVFQMRFFQKRQSRPFHVFNFCWMLEEF